MSFNEYNEPVFDGTDPAFSMADERDEELRFFDEYFDDPLLLIGQYYGLAPRDLPELTTVIGTELDRADTALLLTVHEALAYAPDGWHGRLAMPVWDRPGLCPRAAEIVASLDPASLQKGLLALADQYLDEEFISKKRSLAFPLCRYADESTMAELARRAVKWDRHDVFDTAALYSSTRAAMLYSDRVGTFARYAALRGADEDELRDGPLSDLGLSPDRTKRYDLGGRYVTLRLGGDMSLGFEPEWGRPAKSLPKKGSDPVLYARAKADSDCVRRYAGLIIKNRRDLLLRRYLSGEMQSAEAWKKAYLGNPLLFDAAKGLVWEQAGATFMLTDAGPITASGEAYAVGEAPLRLAHPMELDGKTVAEWQRFLASGGREQPFEQMLEPVRKPADIAPDRYAGVPIPFYRFLHREKHGVRLYERRTARIDPTTDNVIIRSGPELADCGPDTVVAASELTDSNGNRCYEIKRFTFAEYTRRVNHNAAYFDRITLVSRILRDDPDIAELVEGFSAAHLAEFIAIARESHAVNAAAVLLDHQNKRFPGLDPLAELKLEW